MVDKESHRVLVAVDGTERSAGALRFAAAEAAAREIPLDVLHVSPATLPVSPMLPYIPADLEPTGHAIVAAARTTVAELAPDVRVSAELVRGGRVAEIVIRSAHADLVVLGHETRHGLDRVLAGSTVAAVTSRSRCPVAVVPSDWTDQGHRRRVLVGVESQDEAPLLLDVAFAEAARRHARVVVLHAWHVPDAYRDLLDEGTHDVAWSLEARRRIDLLLDRSRSTHPDVRVEVQVVRDQPAHALVHASAEADVVVVLRHSRRHFRGHHLGATVRAVLASAACVVEVVPAPAPALWATDDLRLEESGSMLR